MASFLDLTHDRSRIGLQTSAGAWSYGTIVDLRDRIKSRLDVQLRSGQACALVMGANHVSVAALLAVMRTPHPLVLLPAKLPPEEIRAALDDAGASLLLLPRIAVSPATRVAPPGWSEEGEQDELAFLVRADIPA